MAMDHRLAEIIVPTVAIIFTFGCPVALVFVWKWFKFKDKELQLDAEIRRTSSIALESRVQRLESIILALDGRGADLVLLAQFRVNVALLSSDIQVAAQHQAALRRDVLLEAVEELQLGVEILAAIRHVDGSEAQIADLGLHHARLVIELGMREFRPGGKRRLAQVQRNA